MQQVVQPYETFSIFKVWFWFFFGPTTSFLLIYVTLEFFHFIEIFAQEAILELFVVESNNMVQHAYSNFPQAF